MKFILDINGNAINTAFIENISFVSDKELEETFVEATTYCDKKEHIYTLESFVWTAKDNRSSADEAAKCYIAEIVATINEEAKQ